MSLPRLLLTPRSSAASPAAVASDQCGPSNPLSRALAPSLPGVREEVARRTRPKGRGKREPRGWKGCGDYVEEPGWTPRGVLAQLPSLSPV